MTALLLALAALWSLAGCAKTVGSYRVLKTFGEESFRIGYRLDDQVANYIDAALRALAVTAPECFKVFIILILYLL